MRKHTFIRLLTLTFLIISCFACQKIDISQLFIIHENTLPILVDEEIILSVKVSATQGDDKINLKKIYWSVKDSSGIIIKDDFPDEKEIRWATTEPGKFTITVTVGYGFGNSKSSSKDILVEIDRRLPYTGNYHFMKVTRHWVEFQKDIKDTTFNDGYVLLNPYDKKSASFHIGDGDFGNSGWSETFSAELLYDEGSVHPRIFLGSGGGSTYFYGQFLDTDSLSISVGYGGRGGGTEWKYYGSKIK